ncbi:MAG: hypothetical protein IBX70_07635 [Clostridia bacterium]|nr:hypothetical protein [Clostridia bacterium]
MQSPFLFKPGIIAEDAAEKVIQMSDMNQLVKNNALDEIDIQILKVMHEFKFMTAGLLSQYFKSDPFYSSNFSKTKMRKFMKYGLVRRFYITFEGNDDIHKRTVNFYALSQASMAYLKKYLGLKAFKIGEGELSNVGDILSILALNQAHTNYSRRITSFKETKHDRNNDARTMSIQLYGKSIEIICVRKDQRLDALVDKVERFAKNNDLILLLVEDELNAIEIFKKIEGKYSGHDLHFITDLMMVSEDMYDSYLNVIRNGNDVSIFEYKISEMGIL